MYFLFSVQTGVVPQNQEGISKSGIIPRGDLPTQSHPNIAFIKYWGNCENTLCLPMNGSISMNHDGLATRTTVSFQPSLLFDQLIINGHEVMGQGLDRVSYILDIVRGMANVYDRAEVLTENNFPSGTGIASPAIGVSTSGKQSRGTEPQRTLLGVDQPILETDARKLIIATYENCIQTVNDNHERGAKASRTYEIDDSTARTKLDIGTQEDIIKIA